MIPKSCGSAVRAQPSYVNETIRRSQIAWHSCSSTGEVYDARRGLTPATSSTPRARTPPSPAPRTSRSATLRSSPGAIPFCARSTTCKVTRRSLNQRSALRVSAHFLVPKSSTITQAAYPQPAPPVASCDNRRVLAEALDLSELARVAGDYPSAQLVVLFGS